MRILKELVPIVLQLLPSVIAPKKKDAVVSALVAQRERLTARRAEIDKRLAELRKDGKK